MTEKDPTPPPGIPLRGVARLADVAALAGVGTSIASRILNNDPTVGVRPETRARVITAAKQLNYSPNASARGLKLQRTTTIGLVIPNLAYPVNSEIIRGAERAASSAGYVLLIADAEEFLQAGTAYRRLLLERRVDGLLLASATTSEPFLLDLVRTDLPLVLVNRSAGSVAPSITVDDRLGMRMAVRHLLGLGHRSIGYVSGPGDADTAQRRLEGYLAELKHAHVAPRPECVVESSFDEASGYEASGELLKRWTVPPTAVAVWSVAAAIGLIAGFAAHDLRVPQDISVVAFHDAPIAAYLRPPLTTVRMPLAEMAVLGVEALLRRIAGHTVKSAVVKTRPVVVVRESACRVDGSGRTDR
ncbi:MAG: LacI family DNA-binding transcriptional regulator [Gaiellales bacterium]